MLTLLLVVVILAAIAGLGIMVLGTIVAFIIGLDVGIMALLVDVIVISWMVILSLLWFRILRSDQMIDLFWLDSHLFMTVCPDNYLTSKQFLKWKKALDRQDDRKRQPRRTRRVKRAFFKGIVFIPWPFVTYRIMPTPAFDLPIHVSEILTANRPSKDIEKSARRTRVSQKTTVTVRLSPHHGRLFEAFSILDRRERDFSQNCDMYDNKDHLYRGVPLLAREMLPLFQPAIIDAVKRVCRRYTWGGEQDLVDYQTQVEAEVRQAICQHESAMVHGAIFEEGSIMQFGESVFSVDILFGELTVQPAPANASELEKSMDVPTVELNKARGAIEQGRGEGVARRENARTSKVTPREILSAKTLQGMTNVTLVSAGERILNLVNKLVRK